MQPYDPQGPFLPTQAVSPIESTFLRAANPNEQGRMSSISSTSSGDRGTQLQSLQQASRHISSSAYPPTPLSVDPAGLPSASGWMDRATSYAAARVGDVVPTELEDVLGWGEESELPIQPVSKGNTGYLANQATATIDAGPPVPATAMTDKNTAPRGVRRGRAVGRSFDDVAEE